MNGKNIRGRTCFLDSLIDLYRSLRNFALNSTLNAINFVNSKVLLLEFFEEMFMFCSEKVEPVIRLTSSTLDARTKSGLTS